VLAVDCCRLAVQLVYCAIKTVERLLKTAAAITPLSEKKTNLKKTNLEKANQNLVHHNKIWNHAKIKEIDTGIFE